MAFIRGAVRVSVPATAANLGPGFDSLGLALGLHDEVTVEVIDGSAHEIVVEGEGAGVVPLDESHLVLRALERGLKALGHPLPAVGMRCRNVIPHSRGLGSSAAAIVAGVVAARALVSDPGARDDAAQVADLLQVAAELESHPDNVAPALYGGFVVSGRGHDGRFYAAPSPISEQIAVVCLVPPCGVATSTARGLLPASVPHSDAAANAGRAALLVTALAGHPDLLWEATRDWLHQEQRGPAMPETLEVVHRLRARGVPAVVSGAGPTVLAFAGPELPGEVAAAAPEGWQVLPLPVDRAGARVVDDTGSR